MGLSKAALKQRIKALEKAVKVARKELTRRLKGMNEIREQLTAQASTFATKEYVDTIVKVLVGILVSYVVFKMTSGR